MGEELDHRPGLRHRKFIPVDLFDLANPAVDCDWQRASTCAFSIGILSNLRCGADMNKADRRSAISIRHLPFHDPRRHVGRNRQPGRELPRLRPGIATALGLEPVRRRCDEDRRRRTYDFQLDPRVMHENLHVRRPVISPQLHLHRLPRLATSRMHVADLRRKLSLGGVRQGEQDEGGEDAFHGGGCFPMRIGSLKSQTNGKRKRVQNRDAILIHS